MLGALSVAGPSCGPSSHRAPGPPVALERAPLDPSEVTIVLGGDFAPADAAMERIRRAGYRYPFLATAPLFQEADIAFANLESPVTERTRATLVPKTFLYRIEPAAVEAWGWLGLDLVSLANNHVRDYRAEGLEDTLDALDRAGIAHVGGGRDDADARRPVVFSVGATRVGFVGYLEDRWSYRWVEGLFAAERRPGSAPLDARDVADDLRALHATADLALVSVHWGDNYAPVTSSQRAWAERLAEAGADVVVGHHSHTEQPVAFIGRTLVLYSLGNYAWGAPGHTELSIGLLARLTLRPSSAGERAVLRRVEIVPIRTQNRRVLFQPRRVTSGERALLEPFLEACRKEGTDVRVQDDGEGPIVEVALQQIRGN